MIGLSVVTNDVALVDCALMASIVVGTESNCTVCCEGNVPASIVTVTPTSLVVMISRDASCIVITDSIVLHDVDPVTDVNNDLGHTKQLDCLVLG
jgi:hypothetical protein